jgi:hypothetical protein
MDVAGMDVKNLFIYKGIADENQDGEIFIFVKNMATRPTTEEQINKKPGIIHVILTGWRDMYRTDLPRYHILPYSSHSSPAELEAFVRAVKPKQLFYNDLNKDYVYD